MEDKTISILIVDDDPNVRKTFGNILKLKGYEVDGAGSGAEALILAKQKFFNIAVIDMKLPDVSGFDVLKEIRAINAETVPLMITAYASMDSAIEAMNRGAYSYVTKPVNMDEVLAVLSRALEKQRLSIENKRLQERFSIAADAAGIGVWDLDVPRDILVWDDWMYRLYGVKREGAAGAYAVSTNAIHPDDQTRVQEELQQALRGEKIFDPEFRVVWPDGDIRYLKASARVILDSAGAPVRMVGVNYDITEEKKAAEQTKELADMKSKFASMVSHELRSPLAIIKGAIDLISDGLAGDVSEKQKYFLEAAKENSDRLRRLINNVLDFQKMGAGKMVFNIRGNDLNEVVTEVRKGAVFLSKGKELEFSVQLDEALPPIRFDRDKIIQVLINLVSNAVKYTEKGSVTLSTQRENNVAHVRVQDTGPGVKSEDLSRLFQPFEQLDGGRGKEKGGTGLGLAISKEIIFAHHGKIWAESEVGRGTTIHFILPIIERRVPPR